MKRKILTLLAVVLTLATLMCVTALAVSADAEPSVTIAKFNLAFEDNTYLKYAVRFDGVADEKITENNIGMLYWTDYEGGFVPGTEDYSSKTTGYTDISGVKHYVFEYTHIAAKQLTDYIYSVAYVELDGETYYSEPVKYSALEYAYNRLGKTSAGTTNAELKTLLNNMLAYGASAQQYFDYKEDRLATADFYELTLVGGTLPDGFTSGLYLSTDEVTITAPTELDGVAFASWKDETGDVVYTENPSTVENISKNVTLTAIYGEEIKYSEGLEFTSNGDGTCYVSGIGTCTDTDIVIPSTSPEGWKVTSIGYSAFSHCSSLTSVVIPDSVTSVGKGAFYYCSSLTSVVIPDSVTSISSSAFNNCSSLTSVVIPDSVTSIGGYAFASCSSLTSVVIPDSVTSIGNRAFEECRSLTNIEIPDSVTSIGSGAFELCLSLTSVVIPDSVTSIGDCAFDGCSSLTSVVIGDSVTSIGSGAFELCLSLTSVVIPDSVTSIGSGAFSDCSSLMSVVIGDSVTSIGSYVFRNCSSLASIEVDVNNTVYKSIDGNLYTKDDKILVQYAIGKSNTSFVIPDSVTSIGGGAFRDCYALTSVVIPDSVTSIGDSAFYCCTLLTSVEIPDSVTSIGDCAFDGCSSLTSIEIPDSVTSIGDDAFSHCSSLTSVEIPDSVTNIGDRAFYGCSSLASIEVDVNNAVYKSIDGNLYTKDGKNLLQYAIGKRNTSFAIPDSVTSIGDYAFYICQRLQSIVIGDSVTSIGTYAFSRCTSLTSIEIPDSVTSIGNYAFSYCRSLKDIYYAGSESDWVKITIGSSNDYLKNATIHYNYGK